MMPFLCKDWLTKSLEYIRVIRTLCSKMNLSNEYVVLIRGYNMNY